MITVREMVAAVAVVVFTIQWPVLRSTHHAKNLKSIIIFSLISIGKLEATVVRAFVMLEGQMTDHVKTDFNFVETHVHRSHVQKHFKIMCWQSPGSECRCLTLELEPFTPCHRVLLLTIRGHLPSFLKLLLYRTGVHWRLRQASNKYSLTKNNYLYGIASCSINKLQ